MPNVLSCPGCEAGLVTGQPPTCSGCGRPWSVHAQERLGESVALGMAADADEQRGFAVGAVVLLMFGAVIGYVVRCAIGGMR